MKAKTNKENVRQALVNVNKAQGYKLIFNRQPEMVGNYCFFTIRSKASKIHGASISWSGRNSPSASWEAHGYFFEELLALDQDCIIKTAISTITKDGGNWQDTNIGSMVSPFYASDNAY